jgi:hypothetical protein
MQQFAGGAKDFVFFIQQRPEQFAGSLCLLSKENQGLFHPFVKRPELEYEY